MADGVLKVVHAGATVGPAKKAASPLRFPLEAVERVEHVEQGRMVGGHLRVHLVGDERPHGKVSEDVRTSQLKHLRPDGQRDVEGFVHTVNAAAAAVGERSWVWPMPAAPQHEPVRAPSRPAVAGVVHEPAPAQVVAAVAAPNRQERRLGRLSAVAEVATWIQLGLLIIAMLCILALVIGVAVLVIS